MKDMKVQLLVAPLQNIKSTKLECVEIETDVKVL